MHHQKNFSVYSFLISSLDPYNYPLLYDEQYWWKRNDIDFWRSMIDLSNARRVLEIGSGTGRIALPILKSNVIEYTGIDNSFIFTSYVQKFAQYSNANFICADMINFNLNQTFDLVFVPFNTFLHNTSKQKAHKCVQAVINHMHKDTLFIIDVLVPDPLFLYRSENVRSPIMEFHSSEKNMVVLIEETVNFNTTNNILYITWHYSTALEKDFKIIKFSMKMFYNSELFDLLNSSGLQVTSIWGNYDREPFNEQSTQQIFCCKLN